MTGHLSMSAYAYIFGTCPNIDHDILMLHNLQDMHIA